jgi:hypothetical protein
MKMHTRLFVDYFSQLLSVLGEKEQTKKQKTNKENKSDP